MATRSTKQAFADLIALAAKMFSPEWNIYTVFIEMKDGEKHRVQVRTTASLATCDKHTLAAEIEKCLEQDGFNPKEIARWHSPQAGE